MGSDGKGMVTMKTIGFLTAVVKSQNAELNDDKEGQLEKDIGQLKFRIEKLEQGNR
jgi:hypothetical protein